MPAPVTEVAGQHWGAVKRRKEAGHVGLMGVRAATVCSVRDGPNDDEVRTRDERTP